MKLVGISGALAGSKTAIAVEETLKTAGRLDESLEIEMIDLKDYDVEMVKGYPLEKYNSDTQNVVKTILGADLLVIGTPIYQASISGVLKNLFDHIPQEGFDGKVVGMVATAGSEKHYLVPEYHLKPIIAFLKGVLPARNVFVHNSCFDGSNTIINEDVLNRMETMSKQMLKLHTSK
ncbi:NAD(P)H-dependent oxidoreductase [Rossellomorea vietnamensis]|uniref:NAD(P)H-dependent oxidoreductase n=1 Tax=Rossellomorea vietnamensis TaxID=218284 RepID=A0A5D4MCM9_9BACI|nr:MULTISPECIES: NAD(P)H-dependent oxidoreductase [Bacillaceae]TYR99248.1 NAD(P)H-dependent oxidoreductase [Rossellomorea vietnamensis]